ncbi:DIMBOA UDP-glucosyltransferase BX8-like [Panicum miliaceum]|uniref:DIMBOA UDP-glucosyltransferase BX8-like n=1 Tax=Panicum miliaceum TaxID=4540 RepID=A0A3L6T6T7_PANMI|nr:DIMBOA UDP-glucosyltransferase BX8-like [Panicum miliaceum]
MATGDRRRRVLFFPLPFQGHINPMFQLAGLLHARGFAVPVFHTRFNAPDASRHPAYDFVPVPVPVPDDDGMPVDTPDTVQVTLERVLAVNRACTAPFWERLAALQAPASVLYVSFGSVASMSASDLAETAWGMAISGRPFLWALQPGLVRGAPPSPEQPPLPAGFRAATRGRGTVVAWAPQEEVLAHPAVGGFWTHCGWNSTLEAVCAGVPMLCRPCFGDQMGNARYVERAWRVGVALDGELERGEVEAAIAAVMGGGEAGAGMRRRPAVLKSRAAECCVAEAGSSCLNVDKLVKHIMAL